MSSPIELVTFDLYDTLIELHPTRWERLHAVLARMDISADLDQLAAADLVAEDFYTEENGRTPIRDRPRAEREAFRLSYMERWLAAAELPTDELTVREARQGYLAEFETPAVLDSIGTGYRVFHDVVPALERLQEVGIKRAIISNADSDVTELCTHLDFAHGVDLIVTSALVGYEKPDPRTYHAALEPLGVAAENALHIGDQPLSDVVGAVNIGMGAALIDRYVRHDPAMHAVPVFTGLHELVDHVFEVNARAAGETH